jgi:GGDEF domain-containing protein
MSVNHDLRKSSANRILDNLRNYDTFLDAATDLYRVTGDEFSSLAAAISHLRRLRDTREKQQEADAKASTAPRNEVEHEESADKKKFSFKGSVDQPMTKEELIESHGIDLSKWEIAKIKVKYWDVTAKLKTYAGANKVEGEKLESGRNFSMMVDLIPKVETAADILAESGDQIIESVKRALKPNKPIKKAPPFGADGSTDGNRMLEVSLFDLHLGKLCWGEETGGGNWDSKIAASTALEASKDLLDFFPGYSKIWLPLGHDFFNSDGPGMGGSGGRTTRGTPQDEDSRWAKSFNTGVDVALNMIEMCLEYAPVDITIMRGNHDEERCTYMGRLLAEVYKHHPHVTVDATKGNLKAYEWGDNFIATCHGQLEKEQKVVTECALRFPERFGSARWREIHVGHGHRMRNAAMVLDGWEEQSVRWRMIPSLCEPDDYHSANLYHNHPSAESYLWDKKDLYLGHHAFQNCA